MATANMRKIEKLAKKGEIFNVLCSYLHLNSSFPCMAPSEITYMYVKIRKETEKMGLEKLWGQ